jgi:hypothetical protein
MTATLDSITTRLKVLLRHAEAAIDRRDQRHLSQSVLSAALVTIVLGVGAASAVPAAASAHGPRVDRRTADTQPAAASRSAPMVVVQVPAPASTPPSTAASPPSAVAAAPAAAPAAASVRLPLPTGKGMWIWHPAQTEGGDPNAIVARAQAVGLTHVYVWLGSSVSGFATPDFLNAFLPVAHAHGLRVYGWDFPYLNDADKDVDRAVNDIAYTTPSGDRIDGFAADIELRSMGVNISTATADVYTKDLRQRVGPGYPLIAVVPRPSAELINYPFNEVIRNFDAVAPMVYWLNRDPVADVVGAMQSLAQFHKPILPIGQAYDGQTEGGPHGVPPRPQLLAFMQHAEALGATGISWWSWQHADQQAWDAIRDAPEFSHGRR